MWRCEQLCVVEARGPPTYKLMVLCKDPRSNPFPVARLHAFSHTNHKDPHLRAAGGMPEETLLSAQPSVSCVSAGGHEGSFSLMSLFVLFQSAASSDGGEYHSFITTLKHDSLNI